MNFHIRRRVPLPAGTPFWNRFVNLPIQGNKILFRSVSEGYGDSPKYIAEEILRQKLPYELVWVMGPEGLYTLNSFPKEVKVVLAGTEDALYAYHTSKIQIDSNMRWAIEGGYGKKAGQTYIQTWHGMLGIKKLFWHSPCHLTPEGMDVTRRNIAKVDYLVSTSLQESIWLRRVFLNQGKMLECGYPRNDILVKESQNKIRTQVMKRLGIPPHKRLLLYAPTWRKETSNVAVYNVDYDRVLLALQHRFGGDWCVAARLHHEMLRAANLLKINDTHIIDVSRYIDTGELLVAADALITDYSSIILDYLLTDKPCFVYAPDRDAYGEEWQFYKHLEEFPFSIAETNDALVDNISFYDKSSYIRDKNLFMKNNGFWRAGHAAEYIVELIKQLAPISRDKS